MIDEIVEKIYLKYGVQVAKKHVWMALFLLASILLAIIFFSTNNQKKSATPNNVNIQQGPNMPPRLKK